MARAPTPVPSTIPVTHSSSWPPSAATSFQNVGFGQTLDNSAPWAMFSTGGGSLPVGLYARTNGPTVTDTPITGVDPSTPHRYRIEWNASEVVFYVDGTAGGLATREPSAPRCVRSPATSTTVGPRLTVDWMRMSPYASSGTFQSRVLDSSQSGTDWISLTSTTQTPAGTEVDLRDPLRQLGHARRVVV